MNLILFTEEEIERPLPRIDVRADHILKVLKIQQGQDFDVGQINGPRGKAILLGINSDTLDLEFAWLSEPPELYPIDLWLSFCRPQICRRVLQEGASLGVKSITLFDTEKSEATYRDSRLWTTGEAQRLLIRGAEQAFCTRIPALNLTTTLSGAIATHFSRGICIALDNYEGTLGLGKVPVSGSQVTLAVGGERGWSTAERNTLRKHGFVLADLGPRVLRTDTACIAAISILRHLFAD